jgi:hypothetical protein
VTAAAVPGIEIDEASDVTVSRGSFIGDDGVQVNSGASGVDITSNSVRTGDVVPAISMTGVPGAEVTGNTLMTECGQGIVVSGGSAGASIENNIVSAWGATASKCAGANTAITVAADSTPGTTSDYNLIDPAIGGPLYNWGGTSYSDLAAFQEASGEGTHDLYASPDLGSQRLTSTLGYGESTWYPLGATSPAIDSANADAPGELSTDQLDNPRAGDPSVTNTGTGSGTGTSTDYFDRGAVELEGPVSEGGGSALPGGSLTITARSQVTSGWVTNGPIGIYGVVMNVTVTKPAKSGYLTVFPGTGTAPGTSNLNFSPGQTISNLVTVQVSGGKVSFRNTSGGTVQVVADLAGFYGAAGNGFQPQTPVRVLDTRNGTGAAKAAVAAGGRVRLNLTGDVPAGTTAVVLNVTVTGPRKAGWLAVIPDSPAVPGTSSINFSAGQTLANQVIVPLTNGVADLYNGTAGTVQVVADLDGYYAPTARNFFVPLGPARQDDTRTDGYGPITSGETYPRVSVVGDSGCFPGSACPMITAGVLNMTVTQPAKPGYIIVYPFGAARPATSSADFVAGETVPNLVTTGVGFNGAVSVYNDSAGTIQLVTDEYGYFIASS